MSIRSRKWQPTPVFSPGKFHRQRSLAGYSPWGCKKSDKIEVLTTRIVLTMKDRDREIRLLQWWSKDLHKFGWTLKILCWVIDHVLYDFISMKYPGYENLQRQRVDYYLLCACLVAQLCPTLCDRTDCGPPGSSVHGDSLGKDTGMVAISSSRGSSQPKDQTHVSWIYRQSLHYWATREALNYLRFALIIK